MLYINEFCGPDKAELRYIIGEEMVLTKNVVAITIDRVPKDLSPTVLTELLEKFGVLEGCEDMTVSRDTFAKVFLFDKEGSLVESIYIKHDDDRNDWIAKFNDKDFVMGRQFFPETLIFRSFTKDKGSCVVKASVSTVSKIH